MTAYRRNFIPGGSFFFTVALAERKRSLLTTHVDLLRAAFRETRRSHPFAIDAIVILPDHLHAVWTMPDGDADFAMRWRQIKSMFSRNLGVNESRRVGSPKASLESGSAAIGSILSVTKRTLRDTSTM